MGKLNVQSRTLFIADNLGVLRGINSESVDLVATDPPFNKGVKAFEGIVTAGVDKQGKKVKYKDVWTWGDVQEEWTDSIREDHPKLHAVIQAANGAAGEDMGAFLCWLAVRALEMHRVLKPTGSIYLHIDHTAHAYAKAMMDAIFGRANFRNEIVWCYSTSGRAKRFFAPKHDTILLYTKSDEGYWGDYRIPVSEKYLKSHYRQRDHKGNRVRIRVDAGKERVYYPEEGMTCNDWWEIPYVNSMAKERTGYPTQKPLALYERIIKASSQEGEVVLDPFAGCATTCVAAERLGRGWIGIDINREARGVVLSRLLKEAQMAQGAQSWNRAVQVKTKPPKRTDDGKEAAPELELVSPKPKAPRLSARELRGRLVIADGLKCQGCGWIPHHEEYMEVDHRVPRSLGGRDDMRNRVLLCSPCNGAKGNKLTLAQLRERRVKEGRMQDKAWDEAWYLRVGRFG